MENENIEMMGTKRTITLIEDGPGPGKGRKQCKNCSKYVGVRTSKCDCGYEFPMKAAGRDLIPEVPIVKDLTVAEGKPGKGQKLCPKCKSIIGARSRSCTNCNHIFSFVEKEVAEPHLVTGGMGVRIIYTPAGTCPVKLQGTTFEQVSEWAEKVLAVGERDNLRYLPAALKYFVRHSFDMFSKEWREATTALAEWVQINMTPTPQNIEN